MEEIINLYEIHLEELKRHLKEILESEEIIKKQLSVAIDSNSRNILDLLLERLETLDVLINFTIDQYNEDNFKGCISRRVKA